MIILMWIIFSLLVGMIGSGRTIGFWGAFLISLFLSPLIGLIFAVVSKDKANEKHKAEVLLHQQRQTIALQESIKTNQQNVTDELERIAKLKEQGHLSEEEYQKLKNNIITKFD